MSTREEQREVLQKIVEHIVRRRLATVAIFTLESLRPLSFVASQALIVLGPVIQPFVSPDEYTIFCEALEDRDNLDWLMDRLEEAEAGDAGDSEPNSEDKQH